MLDIDSEYSIKLLALLRLALLEAKGSNRSRMIMRYLLLSIKVRIGRVEIFLTVRVHLMLVLE